MKLTLSDRQQGGFSVLYGGDQLRFCGVIVHIEYIPEINERITPIYYKIE